MRTPLVKIIVFVPLTHLHPLRDAVGEAGAGSIGEYHRCSFVTQGRGYFTPSTHTNPTIGKAHEESEVPEAKLEFLCYETDVQAAIDIIKANHPYEQVALDVIPLLNHRYSI